MNAHLQRARLLIDQGRHELAETELRQLLAEDPENAYAFCLLALCLSESEKYDEATSASRKAIELEPDFPFAFYTASVISLERNDIASAEREIMSAIDLDPHQPHQFSQLAAIRIQQKKWMAALQAAEAGLEIDPENVTCTNLRAVALNSLGRKDEADSVIKSALKLAPENALSHANMGWNQLGQRQPEKAIEHFHEALRLNPNLEWARTGMVEAMKARYFIYRMMLSWFLWMSKLQGRYAGMIIFGGYFAYLACVRLLRQMPELAWLLMPLIIAYVAFVIMTWVAVPMFNLILRTSRFGRMALSDEQKRTSTAVGISLLGAVLFVVAYFATGNQNFLRGALVGGLLLPALGSYYNTDQGWPRAVHSLTVIAMLFLGGIVLAGTVGELLAGPMLLKSWQVVIHVAFIPFLILALGTQIGVNVLANVHPQKGTSTARTVWLAGSVALGVMAVLFSLILALLFMGAYQSSVDEAQNQGDVSINSVQWFEPPAIVTYTMAMDGYRPIVS